MAKNKKIMVLGFDGCSYNFLLPLIKKGKLPNFASMMEEGVHGDLRSTVPPLSGPAWATFTTGKLPGKHGIYDFFRNMPQEYSCTPINNSFLSEKPFWEILSDQGKRIGAMNMLFTYPPSEVNGFIIAGRETPSEDAAYTFPEELKDEILSQEPGYKVELHRNISRTRHFLGQVVKRLECQERINGYLMQKYPCDLATSFFAIPDILNHLFWACMDPEHPDFNKKDSDKFLPLIEECFVALDAIVGKRLRSMDDDTILMIMSDHGAGPLHKTVQINKWLEDEGLFLLKEAYKNRKASPLLFVKKAIGRLIHKASSIDIFGIRRIIGLKTREKRRTFARHKMVEWSGTKAYAGRSGEYGIHINLKGREGQGRVEPGDEYEKLRDHIIERLSELRDPANNNKVFSKIWKREELYEGGHMEDAPDLIFDFGSNPYLPGDSLLAETVFEPVLEGGLAGMHRDHGVFIAKGGGVKKGSTIEGAHICDLAPTILYLMGAKLPTDMDGKVLKDMLESPEAFWEVRYDDQMKTTDNEKESVIYSDEETEEINKRLSDLGYL
ncbi:MAG TPA: hypothetical protein ENH38_00110 [Nitrospirae bacterium]|nr:hypothetical protein [Nitrospirota bacterium]HDZ87004.1 hypothetical protein [Nitrospirota bacterium]